MTFKREYIFLIICLFVASACRSDAEKRFIKGCEKIHEYFNSERAKKSFGKIEYTCEKRVEEKLGNDPEFFKNLEKQEAKVQEAAGCSFGASSYISNYHNDFSTDKLVIYTANKDGDTGKMIEVTNNYCGKIGYYIKENGKVESESEFQERLKKEKQYLLEQENEIKASKEFIQKLKVGETICHLSKETHGSYEAYKLIENKEGRYEFIAGKMNFKTQTLEPIKPEYSSTSEPRIFSLTEIEVSRTFPPNESLLGKEDCVKAIQSLHVEKQKAFDSLNLKLGKILCFAKGESGNPEVYIIKEILAESVAWNSDSLYQIPSRLIRLNSAEWDDKLKKIIFSKGESYNERNYYASDLDEKKATLDESKCKELAQEKFKKNKTKESF